MKKLEEYVRSIPDFPEEGIIFRDITSVLQDADGLQLAIDTMQDLVKDLDFDVVAGAESRGFIFGTAIAYNMHKPFILVRKKGKLPCETISEDYDLEYGKATIEINKDAVKPGQKVLLVKPQTYMNLSGESVRELVDYYKIDETSELIVISDDISLGVGQLRIRKKGSAGGHNGLKNIILHLGHDVFQRVKMGVGEKPKNYDLADYVLGHFSKEERTIMDDSVLDACRAIEMMINDDTDQAMNLYNKKKAE